MIEELNGLPILAFADARHLEQWLSEQPEGAAGAWLKLTKKAAQKAGLSKGEAIDAALCHGWIDGQLQKYDDQHWLMRFTPRKARSKWSEVNKRRAMQLIADGRMQAAGTAQIDAAKRDGRWAAAYPPASSAEVPPDLQEAFDAHPSAAQFFSTLRGASRYAILYRIASVKKAETRARKIAQFVAMLERGETIHG